MGLDASYTISMGAPPIDAARAILQRLGVRFNVSSIHGRGSERFHTQFMSDVLSKVPRTDVITAPWMTSHMSVADGGPLNSDPMMTSHMSTFTQLRCFTLRVPSGPTRALHFQLHFPAPAYLQEKNRFVFFVWNNAPKDIPRS